jgi:3-phenylpropionate/trans-cinnamate dioxygenase ferredoxin subunit
VSERLVLCPVDELAADSARRFDVDGHRIAVIRLGEEFFAIGDRCSHADYSLAEGEIDTADKTLECWKHGSAFSLETGEPICLPATKPVPVYKVEVLDGVITVVAEEDANA